MPGRWGLQAKMTASYVLVTAAAVVLVEAVVLGIVVPGLVTRADGTTLVQRTAVDYANTAIQRSASLGRLPDSRELQLGDPALRLGPGEAQVANDGAGVAIPYTTVPRDDAEPMSLALLLAPDGRIVTSSYPARYQLGERVGGPSVGALPARIRAQPPTAWVKGGGLIATPTQNEEVLWATAPVVDLGSKSDVLRRAAKPLLPADLLGVVYVQVPAAANLAGTSAWSRALGPQLGIGLLVLAAAVPVGLVFGLLSTRRLTGRLRRLAATTVCHAYRERLGVTVEADLEPVVLAPAAEHAVLRVVQEALANAVKHARLNRIRLQLHHQDGRVAVIVSDDGGGFDPAQSQQRRGLGLGLMRERVVELGGMFQLDASPGQGTRVRILLPAGR